MKRLSLVLALLTSFVSLDAARAAEPEHLSIEEVIDCVLKSLPPSAQGAFVLDWRSAKGEERKIEGRYWSEQPEDSARKVIVASSNGGGRGADRLSVQRGRRDQDLHRGARRPAAARPWSADRSLRCLCGQRLYCAASRRTRYRPRLRAPARVRSTRTPTSDPVMEIQKTVFTNHKDAYGKDCKMKR